jgi:transcriptional regulator with XRE-family HTH domain
LADTAQEVWIAQTVGERIGLLRRRARMNQTTLARLMGEVGKKTDQTTLSQFESGRRRPSLAHLLAIARVLNVTLTELGVTEDAYPDVRLFRDPATGSHIA